MNLQRTLRLALLACLTVFLPACGGGGSTGAASTGSPTVQLLLGDAPIDELSAFSVVVDAVHLRDAGGTETANLLAAPRRADLMNLVAQSELMQVRTVATGQYTGFRVVVDPASIDARDLSGAPVSVTVASAETIAPFVAPVFAGQGVSLRLHLDIELERSLRAGAAAGAYVLDLRASATDRSTSREPLDEVHGRVLAVDAAARTLRVELRRRDDSVSFGELSVRTTPATAYFDDDARSVSEGVFFAAATLATARIEARGALDLDGVFEATQIQVEDDLSGGGRGEIRGRIVGLDQAQQVLTLQIRSIRDGFTQISPVLGSLGSPGTVQVGYAGAVVLRRDPVAAAATAQDLRIGQCIEVRFAQFDTQPFPARRIEIEDSRPEFEGTVTDVAGLPAFFVMRLEHHDPSVLSGAVASSRTDVTVRLDGTERIWLQTDGEPSLQAIRIPAGVRVRVRGTLSGTAQAPEIDAVDARLKPGRLEGRVRGANPATRTFTVAWTDLDEPFGNGVPSTNPVAATLAETVRVRGDARTVAGLLGILSTAGAEVEVRVFGIADAAGGLEVFEVVVDDDR